MSTLRVVVLAPGFRRRSRFILCLVSVTVLLSLPRGVVEFHLHPGRPVLAAIGSKRSEFNVGFVFVSCLSRTNCVGLSDVGTAQRWNGHVWGQVTQLFSDRNDGVQGIACSSAGFCEAVTTADHFIYIYNPGKPPRLPVLCGSLVCKATTT